MSKCKICKGEYKKISITHKTCGIDCAIELVKRDKEKKAAKSERIAAQEAKKKKIDMRTRSEWLKLAQQAFNAYIRKRDILRHKVCICCGRPLIEQGHGGGFDCGHYRSIGSAPHLRFCEDNAHGQTKQCNRWGSGRAVDYRLGLINRIGLEAVERLEADQTPRKWTIEELIELRKLYKQKLRAIS